VLYFIAKYDQMPNFFTVTLQVGLLYIEVNHLSCQTFESTNCVCRQRESNTEFKGNK